MRLKSLPSMRSSAAQTNSYFRLARGNFARAESDRVAAGGIASFRLPTCIPAALRCIRGRTAAPGFLADAERRAIDIDPVGGAEIQDLIEQIYKTPPALVAS